MDLSKSVVVLSLRIWIFLEYKLNDVAVDLLINLVAGSLIGVLLAMHDKPDLALYNGRF